MKKHIILTALTFGIASLCGYADDSNPAKAAWDKHCKKCHAEDGSGNTAIGKKLQLKDYTKAETLAKVSDDELFKMTKEGVADTKMPGFADKLSDEEIKALVAYMRGMAK